MDEQLEKLMALGMTEEEAKQVLQDDNEIAHGADLFPLTPEQEKASAQARRAERKKDAKPRERKRKEDADKRELIAMIFDLFRETCVDDEPIAEIKITNPERQLDFEYHGRKFRVVLSAPRS